MIHTPPPSPQPPDPTSSGTSDTPAPPDTPDTPGIPQAGDYRIRLDAYAGPLDLLLYLVKHHEIDLHDIPMARLTEQYLRHLEVIKQIDVESAGEFLVMAATLVEVKSRMIIPTSQRPEDADDPTQDIPNEPEQDPRYELVQQLLAYKAYKDAAYALEDRALQWENRFPAHACAGQRPPEETQPQEKTLDLEDVNIFDLCEAFANILESVGHLGDHAVTYDDTPISLHAEDIHDRLQRDAPPEGLSLAEVFQGRSGKSEMIGLFLATLELVRQHLVTVVVDEKHPPASPDALPAGPGEAGGPGAHIRLVLVPESERQRDQHDTDTATNWADPATGQMQYDWPDEASRLRAERRERLRSTLQAKQDAEARGEAFDLKQYKAAHAHEAGEPLDELDEEELAIEADDAGDL